MLKWNVHSYFVCEHSMISQIRESCVRRLNCARRNGSSHLVSSKQDL